MSAGILNLRNYLVISAIVAALLYVLQGLAGQTFVTALISLNRAAKATGLIPVLADMVTEPLRAVLTPGSVPGAIAGGLMWPLLGVWCLLVFVLVFYSLLASGLGRAGNTIRS